MFFLHIFYIFYNMSVTQFWGLSSLVCFDSGSSFLGQCVNFFFALVS